MPTRDVELLRYRSLSDFSGTNNLRRAQSEASVHVRQREGGFSMLKLSKTRVTVGDSLTVYWDIHESCSANDWVGLFDLDSPTSLSNYLDCKQRGVTGARRGAIKWVISRNVDLNNVENKCIFKYIFANTGSIRAISPTLFIHNPYAEIQGSGGRRQASISQDTLHEISVSGLNALGLKKNIFGKPSPYVKLSIIPSRRHFRSWKHHHGQIAKTSSQSHTINPNWQNEEFVFVGGADDVLEVEVRNKFSGTRPAFSRFLGKLSVPIHDVFNIEEDGSEFLVNKPLCKRTPSDRIQGRIRLSISTLKPVNTSSSADQDAEVSTQQNSRPTNLNVTPSSSVMMSSNPTLRSSAPDLTQSSQLDLSSTPNSGSHLEPNSPVSPYDTQPPGENNARPNRRRNMSRESRPFSEFYSEEFVPLDLEIPSPRRQATLATVSSNLNGESFDSVEHVPNGDADEHETNGITENTEERTRLTSDSTDNLDSDAEISSQDHLEGSLPTPFEPRASSATEESAIPQAATEEQPPESPIETVDSEENEEEIDDEDDGAGNEAEGVDDNEDMNLQQVASSMRSSVASIELTEDSPLRILEESEQALDEEATFSPRNDDSDEIDEDEQTDQEYRFLYGNPNDGDDEMESERSTPDDELASAAPSVISVDSWTYDSEAASSETATNPDLMETSTSLSEQATEPAASASDKRGPSPSQGSCVQGSSVVDTLLESTEIPEGDAQVEDRRAASRAREVLDGSSEPAVSSSPPTNQTAEPNDNALRRQLSLVDTVDEIIENNNVDEGAGARTRPQVNQIRISTERTKHVQRTTDRQSSSSSSRLSRPDVQSNPIDLSSVAFPMEESEPDCMDVTSIQSSSTAQMLVDTSSKWTEVRNSSLTRSDDSRSSTRSDGRPATEEDPSTPTRPARRSKNLSRSLSDSRGTRLSHRPERPERTRRKRTETDPRISTEQEAVDPRDSQAVRAGISAMINFSQERGAAATPAIARPVTTSGTASSSATKTSTSTSNNIRLHVSLSDSVVVAVPVTTSDSLTSSTASSARSRTDMSQHAVVVASAMPSSPVSVTPLPSPTLEAESRNSESLSNEVETVVAVPVSGSDTASSDTTLVAAGTIASPREGATASVTPVPSPTAADSNWTELRLTSAEHQHARREESAATRRASNSSIVASPSSSSSSVQRTSASAAAAASAAASAAPSTNDSSSTGAIPKPSPGDLNRENITRMLRTYVRSAQAPQRSNQTNDPRLRRMSTEDGSSSLPERGRPPRHDAAVTHSASRRRSSRQQRHQNDRAQQEHDRSEAQPVHLQIQDNEQRGRRSSDAEPLPPNWERGVDSHGRVYYIDHANRTTTWTRPTREAPQNETNMNEINTHWQSLDRRYQSFRRTLRGRNRGQPRLPLPESIRRTQSNESTVSASNASSADTTSRSGTSSRSTVTPSSASTPVQSESLPQPPSSATAAGSTPVSTSSASTPASPSTTSSSTPSTPSSSHTPSSSRSQAGASSSSRSRSGMSSSARSAALLESPAVKFITRPDFVDYIKSSGVAGQYYFQSQMLKLIISKIRADPMQFEKYRHQVELVRFLNQFADPQLELAPGWDKKVDQNGRLYFIDHTTRTTTFIDPRLPISGTVRRHRAGTETEPRRSRAPPPRPPPPRGHSRNSSTDANLTTLSYNQQVIGFLSQSNIDDIINRKQPSYARNMALKANIRRAQCEGERALERLSNNVDFVMLLSLFEDEIMSFVPPEVAQKAEPPSPSSSLPTSPVRTPLVNRIPAVDSIAKGGSGGASASSAPSPAPYRRDFEAKVRSFHRQLYHKGYGQGPNKIKMIIRRDRLLEDAYDQIMKETPRSLQRNRLEIQFVGEEGLDYGGPAREFFFLISRQIFNPYYGLFEYSANDTYTVQVSPVSLYVDNSHEWFRFCGRIIGLVIIHQHLLDAFFTRTYYKALLRSSCDLSDVESLDALFHQSMTWVIENNIEDVLDLTFTVSEEIFGQVTERELIPGGKDIAVTEANKIEYVNEMVKWRVERGVSEQMESIVRGFNEVIDPNLMSIFDARELELVISGTADIDIKDWRRNTEYRSGYHDSHKVVKWFWKSVSSFDNEQRLRLLQFVTGTSSIPYEGFAALRGSTGPRKFSIERWGDYTKLPRAHTCFNRLDLPVYRSYEELLEKLTFAVEETGTFSMQ